ncbi:hypothetical protein D3C72_1499550 [compost metagenome]
MFFSFLSLTIFLAAILYKNVGIVTTFFSSPIPFEKISSHSFHSMLYHPTGYAFPPMFLSSDPAIASATCLTVTIVVPPFGYIKFLLLLFLIISAINCQTGFLPGCAPNIYGNSNTATSILPSFANLRTISSWSILLRIYGWCFVNSKCFHSFAKYEKYDPSITTFFTPHSFAIFSIFSKGTMLNFLYNSYVDSPGFGSTLSSTPAAKTKPSQPSKCFLNSSSDKSI